MDIIILRNLKYASLTTVPVKKKEKKLPLHYLIFSNAVTYKLKDWSCKIGNL